MESRSDHLRWMIGRFFSYITFTFNLADEYMKYTIEDEMNPLLDLLKKANSANMLFYSNILFSDEELDFFRHSYEPGKYNRVCSTYYHCSFELHIKAKRLHDKIADFLHN